MNNFAPNSYNNPYAMGRQSVAGQNALIQRVSYLLCMTLLVTAATAW